jgi:hypothetical protein
VRFRPLDGIVLAWALTVLAMTTVRQGSFGAFITKAGITFDILVMYFLGRCWLRTWADVDRMLRGFAALSLVMLALFFFETVTRRNPFAFFGGWREEAVLRDGRVRCRGPYDHPILAGSFWAVLLPILAARALLPRGRTLAAAGAVAVLGITFLSASSTPILTAAAAVFALFMFPMRGEMRSIRWAVVAGLVVVHFAREAPVWHLLARINFVAGSTGFHRYHLIDQAINRFWEWAAVGTASTAHWGYYLFDVTNQYVKEAISGGIAGLTLFLVMIAVAFGYVGRIWRRQGRTPGVAVMAWGLGASLFAMCCMFVAVSISHAQQNLGLLLLTLATVCSMEEASRRPATARTAPGRPAPERPAPGRRRVRRLHRVVEPVAAGS